MIFDQVFPKYFHISHLAHAGPGRAHPGPATGSLRAGGPGAAAAASGLPLRHGPFQVGSRVATALLVVYIAEPGAR